MVDSTFQAEPSMNEILATIRDIMGEDDRYAPLPSEATAPDTTRRSKRLPAGVRVSAGGRTLEESREPGSAAMVSRDYLMIAARLSGERFLVFV